METNGFRVVQATTLVSLLVLIATGSALADPSSRVRWDILASNPNALVAGGAESATAPDGSMITLTSTGTFIQSASGNVEDADGNGSWAVFPPNSQQPSATGTYHVTGIDFFALAPGTLEGSGLLDDIGELDEGHAGLAPFSALAILTVRLATWYFRAVSSELLRTFLKGSQRPRVRWII